MKEHYVPTPRPVAVPYALVDDRLIHQIAQQRAIVRTAHGFLRHHYRHQILEWIHPEVGPGVAPPVILAGRAGPFRLSRLEPRAEAESKAVAGAGQESRAGADVRVQMVGGHVLHCFRPEDARAVEFAAVLEHLREAQVVAGGRYHAVAAGEERCRLGDVEQFRGLAGVYIGRRLREAIELVRGHVKAAVDHFQRLENALGEEHVQGLAGDDFHDATEHVGGMPVFPGSAGFEGERQLGERLDEIRQHPLLRKNPGVAVHLLDRRVLTEDAVSEARGMAHQVLYRDLALCVYQSQCGCAGSRVLDLYANFHVLELGYEPGHRLVQAEPAFLNQHHRRDADDGLGHRIDAENRVVAHRYFLFAVLPAEALRIREPAVARNQDDH